MPCIQMVARLIERETRYFKLKWSGNHSTKIKKPWDRSRMPLRRFGGRLLYYEPPFLSGCPRGTSGGFCKLREFFTLSSRVKIVGVLPSPTPGLRWRSGSAFVLDLRTRSAASFNAITSTQKETMADQFLSLQHGLLHNV